MRSARRLRLCLIVACASALWVSAASADEYDAMLARAIAAKERALDTNDPASWEDALSLFQQADRIRSTKETKYELGSAAARLRQDDLAVEAFESALALGLEGAARDKARSFVDEKRGELGRLDVQGPAGAEVWVGTRQRGTLPLGRPLVVFAGTARVRVVHEAREQKLSIVVVAGKEQRADFAPLFARTDDAPPPRTPPQAPPPTQPPIVDAAPAGDTLPWALVIAGTTTAIVGAGFALGASATIDTRRDRLAELCAVSDGQDGCTTAEPGKREAAQSEVDAIATWKTVRVLGWIGAGAGLAAAGTGLVLLLGNSREKSGARVVVTPTTGGAAVSVSGSL